MAFILFFVEIAVVIVVISIARNIVKARKPKRLECVVPLSSPRFRPIDTVRSDVMPKHQIKRIPVEECENLAHAHHNLVFIALRHGNAKTTLPFPAMRAVSIAPSELVDVLKLIPDCYVVLCAEADLYPSILEVLKDIAHSTPIYFLESAAVRAQAV